jgi:hypothetical protein
MPTMQPETLTLYAIRRADGEYFRSVGYNGHGVHWRCSLAEAKLYSKLSQARARVTFFASRGLPAPEIVALTLTVSEVFPEGDRVAKVLERKRTEKERREFREAERRLREAQLDLEAAQARLLKEKLREMERLGLRP